MLYIIAIAFCLASTPEDQCDNLTAVQFERIWVYRPNVDECVNFATDYVARGNFDLLGRYPKVFCLRTETFENAYSKVIGYRPQP